MKEFKNTERELHFFRLRLSAVGVFVFVCFGLLLARFLWLQGFKHKDYAAQAEENRISVVPVVPNRGLIIDRINQRESDKIDETEDAANYSGTDYIGKEGLEKSYEKKLHGTTGYEEVEVSAGGRAVRTLSRTPASPGHNLILSIDIELQKV